MRTGAKIRGYFENTYYLEWLIKFARKMKIHEFIHTIRDSKWRKNNPKGDLAKRQFYKQHRTDLQNVYDMLEDIKSKTVYENMLKYRMTHKRKYLKGIIDLNQYFDPEIMQFSDNEVMIDCGAYNGDTVKAFIKRVPGFRHIYALEPDSLINKKIPQNSCITVLQKGAWDKKTTLTFSNSGIGGGYFNGVGNVSICVDTIDHMLSEQLSSKNVGDCSFIKMDIEGSELKALKGGAETIKKYKPKLAICIYHKDEDFFTIPNYIKQLVPEYKLFVRQYSDTGTETVLYAIYKN